MFPRKFFTMLLNFSIVVSNISSFISFLTSGLIKSPSFSFISDNPRNRLQNYLKHSQSVGNDLPIVLLDSIYCGMRKEHFASPIFFLSCFRVFLHCPYFLMYLILFGTTVLFTHEPGHIVTALTNFV